MIAGLFSVDRGAFFTLRQIIIRPGIAANRYLAGERKKYFNFVTLLFVVIGITFFVNKLNVLYIFGGGPGHVVIDGHTTAPTPLQQNKSVNLSNYARYILFAFVPTIALAFTIMYRRCRYRYIENVVAANILLIGTILIFLVSLLGAMILYLLVGNADLMVRIFNLLFLAGMIFYFFLFSFQYQKSNYTLPGLLWRSFATFLLTIVIYTTLFLGFALIYILITGSQNILFSN